jgi:hypothetical protein
MSTGTRSFGNFILLLLLSIISSSGKHELLSFTLATCTVSVFIAHVSRNALIKILYPNATILSPVLQKKVMHQEMFCIRFEPQLRGPKVREFIYFLLTTLLEVLYYSVEWWDDL